MTPYELLERTQWDFFWVPQLPGLAVVDRPELAYLHGPHSVGYANMVTRTRARPARLPGLIAEVLAAHAGRTSRWLVTGTFDHAPLESALARAGYEPSAEFAAVVSEVSGFPPRRAGSASARVVSDRRTLRDSLSVLTRVFDQPPPSTSDYLENTLRGCTGPGARTRRVVAYLNGEPVSTGSFNTYPELGVAFLWGGGTVPEARGQGAYSAVVAKRMQLLKELGVSLAGLYAKRDTSAPIVAKQGFRSVGWMTYCERESSTTAD